MPKTITAFEKGKGRALALHYEPWEVTPMKTSKLLSVVLSVLIALVVLTGSVAVPLLCRSFYYAHIGPMGLEGYGLSRAEIETDRKSVV